MTKKQDEPDYRTLIYKQVMAYLTDMTNRYNFAISGWHESTFLQGYGKD